MIAEEITSHLGFIITAGVAVFGSGGILWKLLANLEKKTDNQFQLLSKMVEDIKETVDSELKLNGGKSLKDTVIRLDQKLDSHLKENEKDHSNLGRSIDILRDEVRTNFERLDRK